MEVVEIISSTISKPEKAVEQLHRDTVNSSIITTMSPENNVTFLELQENVEDFAKNPTHSVKRDHVQTKDHPLILETHQEIPSMEKGLAKQSLEPDSYVEITSASVDFGSSTLPVEEEKKMEKAIFSHPEQDTVTVGKIQHTENILKTSEKSKPSQAHKVQDASTSIIIKNTTISDSSLKLSNAPKHEKAGIFNLTDNQNVTVSYETIPISLEDKMEYQACNVIKDEGFALNVNVSKMDCNEQVTILKGSNQDASKAQVKVEGSISADRTVYSILETDENLEASNVAMKESTMGKMMVSESVIKSQTVTDENIQHQPIENPDLQDASMIVIENKTLVNKSESTQYIVEPMPVEEEDINFTSIKISESPTIKQETVNIIGKELEMTAFQSTGVKHVGSKLSTISVEKEEAMTSIENLTTSLYPEPDKVTLKISEPEHHAPLWSKTQIGLKEKKLSKVTRKRAQMSVGEENIAEGLEKVALFETVNSPKPTKSQLKMHTSKHHVISAIGFQVICNLDQLTYTFEPITKLCMGKF